MTRGSPVAPISATVSAGKRKGGVVARYFPVIVFLLPGIAAADIYAFVDEAGITHFSNIPQDRRYRFVLRSSDASPPLPGLRTPGDRGPAQQFARQVNLSGSAHQVSPALIHAVISAESGYNPNARSPRGAMGLMQLMPGTAQRYQVEDPYDPEQNIRGGVSYLRDLLRQFNNDLPLALAAYNAGEGAVQRHGNRIPPFAETRQYVPRVLNLYDRYMRDNRFAQPGATSLEAEPGRRKDIGNAGGLP